MKSNAVATGLVTAFILAGVACGFVIGRTSPTLSLLGYSIPACSIAWK